jgi:hypothetical protein
VSVLGRAPQLRDRQRRSKAVQWRGGIQKGVEEWSDGMVYGTISGNGFKICSLDAKGMWGGDRQGQPVVCRSGAVSLSGRDPLAGFSVLDAIFGV